jgi:hypothetical protein
MATIVNARDVILQAAGTRVLTAALPSNFTVDFGLVNGSTKPADNADVTQSAVTAGIVVTGGGLTLSLGGSIKGGQTNYATGTGWFLGYSGSAYKFSIGDATHYLRWDGTGMSIAGDITGTSSINITGTAKFGGAISATTALATVTAAVLGNASGASNYGGVFFAGAGNVGVYGQGNGLGSIGAYGYASSTVADGAEGVRGYGDGSGGYGVVGIATGANGVGVYAFHGTGVALRVQGKLAIAASQIGAGSSTGTFVGTAKPGANSNNTWLRFQDDSGNLYDIPVWPR